VAPAVVWLPALIVAGGWIVAWPVSLGLATTTWATTHIAGASSALVGWVLSAILVAAALRWAAPWTPLSRALLIVVGWPTCLLVGLVAPVALGLSYQGAALLAIGVAAAGFLGALAQVAPSRQPPWDRVLVITAGWSAGWLWSGSTAWPQFFRRLAESTDLIADAMSDTKFIQLLAGGAMSGVVGGALMYLLLRHTPRLDQADEDPFFR
jgi:hypothetical protein